MISFYPLIMNMVHRIYLPGKSKSKYATCIGLDLTVHQINLLRHCLEHLHAFPEEMMGSIEDILDPSVIHSVEASPTGEEKDLSVFQDRNIRALPAVVPMESVLDEIDREWAPWLEYKKVQVTQGTIAIVFEGEGHEYRYHLSLPLLQQALES